MALLIQDEVKEELPARAGAVKIPGGLVKRLQRDHVKKPAGIRQKTKRCTEPGSVKKVSDPGSQNKD